MADETLVSKLANALFKGAEPNQQIFRYTVLGLPALAFPRLFAQGRRAYGGLWVGGTVTLSRKALKFVPNTLNRAVHEDGSVPVIEIPLNAIVTAKYRPGFVSGIIDLVHKQGSFTFRCFGAKNFAETIQNTANGQYPGKARSTIP